MVSASEPVVLVASAEFTLKSSVVRRTLEQRLIDDLKTALTKAGFNGFTVEKNAARVVVHRIPDPRSAAQACGRVFGVAYAAPAVMLPVSEQAIMSAVVRLADETLSTGQSFAIRAHRSTPSSLSRRNIEIGGGSEVLQALRDRGIRVGLKKPDVTIFVDLADDRAYVYCDKMQGPGGLPLSSQWRMLAVLDSGLLTVLAAFAMMRRGCLVELFIPISETIPSFERHRQLDIARKLRRLVTRANYRAFTVSVEELLRDIPAKSSLGHSRIRGLVRLAAIGFAKEKKFRGIIFADIAGKIAVQKGPARLEHDQLPIFHPLIGMDQEDLIEMCKQIGVSEQEIVPADYAQLETDVPNELSHLPKCLAGHIVEPILL